MWCKNHWAQLQLKALEIQHFTWGCFFMYKTNTNTGNTSEGCSKKNYDSLKKKKKKSPWGKLALQNSERGDVSSSLQGIEGDIYILQPCSESDLEIPTAKTLSQPISLQISRSPSFDYESLRKCLHSWVFPVSAVNFFLTFFLLLVLETDFLYLHQFLFLSVQFLEVSHEELHYQLCLHQVDDIRSHVIFITGKAPL